MLLLSTGDSSSPVVWIYAACISFLMVGYSTAVFCVLRGLRSLKFRSRHGHTNVVLLPKTTVCCRSLEYLDHSLDDAGSAADRLNLNKWRFRSRDPHSGISRFRFSEDPPFPASAWLPDAHVESPSEGSVLLAGTLMKVGIFFCCDSISRRSRSSLSILLCELSSQDEDL